MLGLHDEKIIETASKYSMPGLEQKSTKSGGRDNTTLAGLTISFVVFVAVPYELYLVGFSMVTDFAITVFVAGFLADIFTTRIGFRQGYSDYNVFYNLARKKSKSEGGALLTSIILFGAIRAAIIIFFLDNSLILIIVATTSLIGPLWNSIILSSQEKELPQPQDLNVSQEIKV